jgi:carbon monoxide dehydrogenase subunit G
MIVEEKIAINADKKSAWKAVTDIRNASKIISGIEQIEILNEPELGLVGLKWRETRMYFGKPSAIDKWITEAGENEFYTTKAEMKGFVFITKMAVSENNGNTLLSSSHEMQAQGVLAKVKSLPMIFFKGVLKKAILKDLNDYKAFIENK